MLSSLPYRQTSDHVLDVEIEPDGRISMKDEHELVAAVEQGRYTQQQADRFRADAEAAIADFHAATPPYDQDWEDFTPDPAWPVPGLPPELAPGG